VFSDGTIYLTKAKIGSYVQIKNVVSNGIVVSGIQAKHSVSIENTAISSCSGIKILCGDLHLKNVKAYELDLNDLQITGDEGNYIGGLYLTESSIETTLCLCRPKINLLWLTFTEPPEEIFVSSDNAQIVHWAAPTVPLVII